MDQDFGRVSARAMDPSRKIESLILTRSGSWTCQVPWRRFRECSELTSRCSSPKGSRNETTQPKMIVNIVVTGHDLCSGAPSLRKVAPGERGFSRSDLRKDR